MRFERETVNENEISNRAARVRKALFDSEDESAPEKREIFDEKIMNLTDDEAATLMGEEDG